MKLTIDTAAALHGLRRWWWRLMTRDLKPPFRVPAHCCECGKLLTPDELHYYGHTCERCEAINFHRFEALEREHMGDPDKETGIYADGVAACDGRVSPPSDADAQQTAGNGARAAKPELPNTDHLADDCRTARK